MHKPAAMTLQMAIWPPPLKTQHWQLLNIPAATIMGSCLIRILCFHCDFFNVCSYALKAFQLVTLECAAAR